MKYSILLCFLLLAVNTKAHNCQKDTLAPIHQNYQQWIAPTALFTSAVLLATVPSLNRLEKNINVEIRKTGRATKIDQVTQFLPAVVVFALDASGIKGMNTPKKQIQLFGVSQLSAAVIVYPMKLITRRERPNGIDKKSFPSGHATRAFVSAELLHQEFGHLSPWISIAGYTTASATAYLRLYQNEHWLGDVLAGAAIGMATTKFVYWLNRKIQSRPKADKSLVASF